MESDRYLVIRCNPGDMDKTMNNADSKGWNLVAVNGPEHHTAIMLLTFERKEGL